MKITKEQEEQIINFGAFGYSENKIANILGLDVAEVSKDIKNQNSDLFKLLEKGKDMSDYVIDLKLFEMAKSGDIKALDKLQLRKVSR
jgi:predicted transcriptional regulator